MTLSPKRQAFVIEYLKDFNGTQAAIRAGYSPRTANEQAAQLLAILSIQEEIRRHIAERAMSADEVLLRLGDMARASIEDFSDIHEGVEHGIYINFNKAKERGKLHLIKKVKYTDKGLPEIELHDAQAALVVLGKHHKLFTEKIEHDVSDNAAASAAALIAAMRGGASEGEVEMNHGADKESGA